MHDHEKIPVINKRQLIAAPLALWLALVVVVFSGGVVYATIKAEADEIGPIKHRLAEHDDALARVLVMSNDIAWIKEELKRQRRETTP